MAGVMLTLNGSFLPPAPVCHCFFELGATTPPVAKYRVFLMSPMIAPCFES
jgi:hypothetical protein